MKILIDGMPMEVPEGTTLEELADQREESAGILLARVDGKLRELHHAVHDGEEVVFLTSSDRAGFDVLRRTLSMIFFAALDAVTGEAAKSTLHFSVGDGYFYTVGDHMQISDELCGRICQEMHRIVEADLPIVKKTCSVRAARKLFRERGMTDKELLFDTRLSSIVNIYYIGDYADYNYGFMASRTGRAGRFDLTPYEDGLLLLMPAWKGGGELRPPKPQALLFENQRFGEAWAYSQGISTIGALNGLVIRSGVRETILISEADQERRISNIAGKIAKRRDVRFVMVAGPSSSGKTTFSQRLCIQLFAHGIRPHYIGVDNYFVDRDKMPLQPDGTKDFEGINAIAMDVFTRDMQTLLEGGTISVPKFDFLTGRRIDSGEKLRLGDREVLVIEGIHCLNDLLTLALPKESKFKIYISALTQLNIDEHNRIPSSDGRLLRRIIRDHRTRGYSAAATLEMWDSVRRGEEKNIFPFQEMADAFFNSALPYEPGVLKAYVEPLLFQVREDSPVYSEARRLLKFLDYFLCIPGDEVPTNSILREFIGGGVFRM